MFSCKRVFWPTDEKSLDQTINSGAVRPIGEKLGSTQSTGLVSAQTHCVRYNWKFKKKKSYLLPMYVTFIYLVISMSL